MKYVEFLDFVGRIAFEYFRDTPDNDLKLHIKIDKILGPLIKSVNSIKQFTFLSKENYTS